MSDENKQVGEQVDEQVGEQVGEQTDEQTKQSSDSPKPIIQPDLSGFSSLQLSHSEQSSGHFHRHHGERVRMSREHIQRAKIKRRHRLVIVAVLFMLLLLVVFAFSCLFSLKKIQSEVSASVAAVSSARQALASGDTAQASNSVRKLSSHIDAVYAQTDSITWQMASLIPYYGSDVTVVRNAVSILERVSQEALPSLTDAASTFSLKNIVLEQGAVKMHGIEEAADQLDKASSVITQASIDLDSSGGTHIAKLTKALDSTKQQFSEFAELLDTYTRIAQLAPGMLDLNGSGTRTYLILAQNNAELRPTGGMPGSWGTLTVSNGRMTMSPFVPASGFSSDRAPVLDLTDDERVLFGNRMMRFAQDVNFTPDFPRAAQIAQTMWNNDYHQRVDGVLAVDPVALQHLLKVTGGVKLSEGTMIDGSNAAQFLLHTIYISSEYQGIEDQTFSTVAGDAFEQITSASSGSALIPAIMKTVAGGHVMLWSANTHEQDLIADTAIGWQLPTKPAQPTLGVYFSDATESKMDWYLKRNVSTKFVRRLSSGADEYEVTVNLINTLDSQNIPKLSTQVLGTGNVEPGSISTMMYLYAPAGGSLHDWRFNGGGEFDTLTTHDTLTVGARNVILRPGESFSVTLRISTAATAGGTELAVRQTPLLE
jgi:hypothetical protein